MSNRLRRILIGVAITIAVVVALYYWYGSSGQKENVIRTWGVVNGLEVNISTKIPGRILEICCDEGETVKQGQVVIRLENDDLRASVDQALAGMERTNAEIRAAETAIENARITIRGADTEIESAQAELEKAQAQLAEAKHDAERSRELYASGFISKAALERSSTNYDAIAAGYKSARAGVASAYSRKESAQAQLGTAVNQLGAVKARRKEAEATLALNQSKLNDAVISSPISGTVMFKALEKGEMVSPGTTILTVVALDDLYVRLDLDETLVSSIALNSEASVKVEGIPGRIFKGRVKEIGQYAEFATQRDITRGRQDIKTFRIKIKVDNSSGRLKPGMTAEVLMPKPRG